jgi:hypothetical protein
LEVANLLELFENVTSQKEIMMGHITEKYINPLTDFGFKRIFGIDSNRDLLISFLNALFECNQDIMDMNYFVSKVFEENEVVCKNAYCALFRKLTSLYTKLCFFDKTETELETMLDKWFFALKNMSKLNHRPEQLPELEFIKLFEIAELDKLDDAERYRYEQSLLYFRDIKNSIDTAIKIGMAKSTSSDSIL